MGVPCVSGAGPACPGANTPNPHAGLRVVLSRSPFQMETPRLGSKAPRPSSAGRTKLRWGPAGPQWLEESRWVENGGPPHPASPEAPPAVWGAIRALAHGHHLTGAEGLPQEHGERALDVQDGGGPLRGRRGRPATAEPLPARASCADGRSDGPAGWAENSALPRKQGYKLESHSRGPGRRTHEQSRQNQPQPQCWGSPGGGGAGASQGASPSRPPQRCQPSNLPGKPGQKPEIVYAISSSKNFAFHFF